MVKTFKEFVSLLEFQKSDHYSNRINVIPEDEKGKPKGDGSRLLPLNQTPFNTGYSIKYLSDLDKNENIGYSSWLKRYNINREEFQKFLSEIWRFQLDNEIIAKRKGNPGIDYIIDPGKIVIKIEDSLFEIYYVSENKEAYNGNKFIILASDDILITLKNASSERRSTWEEELYQHKLRKEGHIFKEKYPTVSDFKKSMRIINLYKKDESIVINLDPLNINVESAIDSIKGIYGIKVRSMAGSYIPDYIEKKLDPSERQIAISIGTKMGSTKDKAQDPKEVFSFIVTDMVDPHYKKGNFNAKSAGSYKGGVKDFWESGDYTTNDQISIKIKYEKPLNLIYNKGEDTEKILTVTSSNMIIKKGDVIWLPKGEGGEMIKVRVTGFMLDKRTSSPFNLSYKEVR